MKPEVKGDINTKPQTVYLDYRVGDGAGAAALAIQRAYKMRGWEISQQAKCNGSSGAFCGTGDPDPMLALSKVH